MPTSRDDLPLVGRKAELAEIAGLLAASIAGSGAACAVVGPAGIGKSRLAAAAVATAREMGFRCVWTVGWPDGGSPPLWPWQSVLAQLGHDEPEHASVPNESERFATFRSISDAIAESAADLPLLIVLDDAHLTDTGALLLARYLARAFRSQRIVLMMTIRDDVELADDVRSALDELVREGTVIRPVALATDALEALMSGAGWTMSATTVDEILALTGGNPLFVRELLAVGAGDSAVTADSIRSLLQMRIRALPDVAVDVLAALAVLGPLAEWPVLAEVAMLDVSTARQMMERAHAAGIVKIGADGVGGFSHGLFADGLLASLAAAEVAGLHGRAADVLSARSDHAEFVVAAAHHRLRAASIRRDTRAVDAATEACRTAAWVLVAGCAYEAASQLLTSVIDLLDRIRAAVPTSVVLQVARADLSAGNLRSARSWFRRAADQAREPADLAEAALGLGGIWVHEHRSAVDHASFMSLLSTALTGLGDARPDLAARLRVRIAAEQIYVGKGTLGHVESMVIAARSLGDPLVLGEALSLWHHTMLGPAHTGPLRLEIADELVRVAAEAGDEVLVLMGGLWRTVDLYLMGDGLAERALAEVRERADALQVGAVLFVLDAIEVMRMIRRGEIADAEAAANRCFELGIAIGDADAVGYLGGHLLSIRWLQLQPEDIVDIARQVATSPSLVEGDVAPRAAAAVLAAMLGDHDRARADLHHAMVKMRRGVDTSSNWMITMFCAVEAARLLDDRKTSEAVYDAVLPYRHLPIIGSLGIVCMGSAERTLGIAATTLGDRELAVHHFDRAVEHNHRLGHRVMAAISEGDLGCALIARGNDGDLAAGRRHVEHALVALDEFGLRRRSASVRAAADGLLAQSAIPDGAVVRSGSGWTISFGEHEVDIADSIGVERLVALLARPGQDVAADELAGAGGRSARHEINDIVALQSYRDRIEELREEIDDAEADHDIERAASRRDELDRLLDLIGPSLGLRGRTRSFADPGERARVTVRKSIGRAFAAIAAVDPGAAGLISASIRTGAVCRFEPVPGVPTVWRIVDRR